MERRIDITRVSTGAMHAMLGLEKYLATSGLDPKLMLLMKLRASQLNGCAYCIDMHWKDLKIEGENEQRMYGLDAWEESPYYTDRERAALAWTEAVTKVADDHVPDRIFEETRRHFTEEELVNLTLCVAAINAWNRLSIALRAPAGTYQPQAKPKKASTQTQAQARLAQAQGDATH